MILGILPVFFGMAYEAEYPREVTVLANCYFVVAEKWWLLYLKGWWQDSLASWNHLDTNVENAMCVPYVGCCALQSSLAPTDSTKISPIQVSLPRWLPLSVGIAAAAAGLGLVLLISELISFFLCVSSSGSLKVLEREIYHVCCSQMRPSKAQTRDDNLVSVDVIASDGCCWNWSPDLGSRGIFPPHQTAKDHCPPL